MKKLVLSVLVVTALLASISMIAALEFHTGYNFPAEKDLMGFRMRQLKNPSGAGGGEVYLGSPDLGVGNQRVELDFYYTYSWKWSPETNDFTFVYDPNSDELRFDLAHIPKTLVYRNVSAKVAQYGGGYTLDQMNVMTLNVVGRKNLNLLKVTDVEIDGEDVPDMDGTGKWATFQITGVDWDAGFTMTGKMEMSGAGWHGENNKVEIKVGYSSAVTPPCTDEDGDGLGEDPDNLDACPIPGILDECLDSVADNIKLNPNQYAQNDLSTSAFETGALEGQSLVYSMAETKGCTCKQIVEALDKGKGHLKKGCSPSVMEEWTGINAELDRSSKIGRRAGITGAVIDFFDSLF